jgi:histidine triad (HIT) family protein
MENCIFCKIVSGEIPSAKILEDDNFIAFLGVFPKYPGMTVIATKKHVSSYLYQSLDDNELASMHLFTKRIARAIDRSLGSRRCMQVMEGLEVDHGHLKLFPCYEDKDDCMGEGKEMTSIEVLLPVAEKIKNVL